MLIRCYLLKIKLGLKPKQRRKVFVQKKNKISRASAHWAQYLSLVYIQVRFLLPLKNRLKNPLKTSLPFTQSGYKFTKIIHPYFVFHICMFCVYRVMH